MGTNLNTCNFKTLSILEIKSLNFKIGEKFLIQKIDTCEFTGAETINELEATVSNVKISDSLFDLSFVYVNDYGLDNYVSFENIWVKDKI